MNKLVLNPSRIASFAKCKFLYYVRFVKNQTLMPNFAPKREFGSLVHEAEAAHDLMRSVEKSVKKKVAQWRESFWYNVKYSKGLSLLEAECLKLHRGGTFVDGKGKGTKVQSYASWSEKNLHSTEVVDVEKRLFVDVGPVILAPKLDLVVETFDWETVEDGLWLIERKTTGRWDDKNWKFRWSLDAQTTLQLIAAETHYDREFIGVMVEPIQIARVNRKDVPEPQPIGKAERLPMKWVRKPAGAVALMMSYLEDLSRDIPQRTNWSNWPTDGMASGSCEYCSMRQYCLGNDQKLLPREPDDIDKFSKKGEEVTK